MISDVKSMPLTSKLSVFKRVIIEFIIIVIIASIFYWCALLFLSFMSLFIAPSPYYHSFSPHYHIRNLKPNTLVTLLVNSQLKRSVCEGEAPSYFFNDLTLPQHEFCNIEQETMPIMTGKTYVYLKEAEGTAVRYVKGCMRMVGDEEMSCQKYPVSQEIVVFRNLELESAYFIQIELQLIQGASTSLNSVTIELVEQCNFLSRFIKDYYYVFLIIFITTVTVLLTILAFFFRLKCIITSILEDQQQEKEQTEKLKEIKMKSQMVKQKENIALTEAKLKKN